jgi:hypothetical protein
VVVDDNFELKDTDYLSDTYDIYKYADNLFTFYGKDQTASLMFEHVLFIPNEKNLFDFIELIIKSNVTNQDIDVKFMQSENKFANYRITFGNQKYVNKFKRLYQAYKKLNDESRHQNEMAKKRLDTWLRPFAALMNYGNRWGKSIFSTQHTLSINEHIALENTAGTHMRRVDLKHGFSSHFRKRLDVFFNNMTFPIDHFMFDYEYYLYTLSNLEIIFEL